MRRTALVGLAALAFAVALWDLGETYREVDRSEEYERVGRPSSLWRARSKRGPS